MMLQAVISPPEAACRALPSAASGRGRRRTQAVQPRRTRPRFGCHRSHHVVDLLYNGDNRRLIGSVAVDVEIPMGTSPTARRAAVGAHRPHRRLQLQGLAMGYSPRWPLGFRHGFQPQATR